MASQGLGSLQDASQDVGDISKIGTWECWSSPNIHMYEDDNDVEND